SITRDAVHPALPLRVLSYRSPDHRHLPSFPTRRSSDLHQRQDSPGSAERITSWPDSWKCAVACLSGEESQQATFPQTRHSRRCRSEEHTSELQSQSNLVCRLLLEKKKKLASPTSQDCQY